VPHFFESLDFAKPPLKRFGREWSANKSTRRRVEAGNIHFVKVNGAAAARESASRGEKPVDVPVVQPAKFEFVIKPKDGKDTGA